MAQTSIEWTQKVWNPTVCCDKVSAGCKNCYAEVMHKRLMVMQPKKYSKPFLTGAMPYEPDLLKPLSWKKPVRIFANSMSDLFHKDIPFGYIDKVFAIMACCPQHTFQILTKRPERMKQYFSTMITTSMIRWKNLAYELTGQLIAEEGEWEFPLPNVWLGTSVEDQATADERIPHLLQVPAAIRWLSCEPLLGQINLRLFSGHVLNHKLDHLAAGKGKDSGIHWVVTGGESGHKARPMHPDWPRNLRNQCKDAKIPFFFKQWGEWAPSNLFADGKSRDCKGARSDGSIGSAFGAKEILVKVGKNKSGRLLDGKEHNEYPAISKKSVKTEA